MGEPLFRRNSRRYHYKITRRVIHTGEMPSQAERNFAFSSGKKGQSWLLPRIFSLRLLSAILRCLFRSCRNGGTFRYSILSLLNFEERFLQICKGRTFLTHPFSQFWEAVILLLRETQGQTAHELFLFSIFRHFKQKFNMSVA